MQKKQHNRKKAVAFDDAGEEVHHDESNWLISYADMMTLLMGFFILMYSMSITDESKFSSVSQEVAKYFGGPLEEDPRIKEVYGKVSGVLSNNEIEKFAHVEFKNGKIFIKFDNEILFKSGSPYLTKKARQAIKSVGAVLAKIKGLEEVKVNGHTDSVPIKSRYYPSNWELSAARASTIVRHFNSKGVPGKKLRVIGHGGTKPLLPDKDENGKYIKKNLKVNRRVEVEVKLARNTNIMKFKKKSMFSFLKSDNKEEETKREPSSKENKDKSIHELTDKEIEERYQKAQEKLKKTNQRLRKIQSLQKQKEKRLKMMQKIEELEGKAQKSEQELQKYN